MAGEAGEFGSGRSWWSDGPALARFVADLIAGEFARLRPGFEVFAGLSGGDGPGGEAWRDGLIEADSLEMLQLSAALAEALNLGEAGSADYLPTRRTFGGLLDTCRSALPRCGSHITFRTSGSTGAAKPCRHRLADLEQEAEFLRALFPGRRRILGAVPCHHIYGFLMTILAGAPRGAARLPVVDVRGRAPAALAVLAAPGDLIVGHPAFWSAVVRSGITLPAGVHGSVSTAPCPAETARGAIRAGLDRLVELYGSSETGGIGWRDEPADGFRPMPWWRRAGDSTLRRTSADGTERDVPAPDRLDWSADGRFRVAGRLDGMVQVGGANVSPDHVRRRLCEHPWVADAAVRLMTPDEGDRLKAFVVPAPDAPAGPEFHQALTRWIDRNLTVPERPRALASGPSLPSNSFGKDADWTVRQAFPTPRSPRSLP
ncbi:AMP-binding protein [Skermanella mucosa]|uniref:AMP-binding protein n=1 Tax=Skermanella mucosa TaxID=1789672 RepID=UPI00192B652D|nr:AMP-binding protein [Skermanella mucosa]UEM22206.1 AMP-binding protein [Skermanella mucosa]